MTTQTDSTYVFDLSGKAEPYDIKSSPIEKKQVDLIAKGVILAASVSPSKKYLVLCDDYKQLRLYRLNIGEILYVCSLNNFQLSCFTFLKPILSIMCSIQSARNPPFKICCKVTTHK